MSSIETNPSREQNNIFMWFGLKVLTEYRNLVVRARAGTGKTSTIIAALVHAVERSILVAAFNKDIATELNARIAKLGRQGVEAKTLHALGCKFCFRNIKGLKIDDSGERALSLAVRACGDDAPKAALTLVKNLHTKAREIEPFAKSAHQLQLLASQFNCIPDEALEDKGWDVARVCEAAFAAIQYAKEPTTVIDFADMIFLPLVHNWIRPWYDMVIVDEAQDMTIAQLTLAERACKRSGRICIVGDDRQAIYAFRGADSGSLDRLKHRLQATELSLTTTYRCPKLVVALAQKLVPDFQAAPTAPEGVILKCDSDKMIADAKEGDFILSRTNAPLIKICMALLKRGVRARIKGRDIGRGLKALLTKLGVSTIAELALSVNEWANREVERAIDKLDEDAADERCDFVRDQRDILLALSEDAKTIDELNQRLDNLFSDDAQKCAVMCSTVHRAKGLESERVFLLEGTFRNGSIEEENIRYVAITRSKHTLVWVSGYERAKKQTGK